MLAFIYGCIFILAEGGLKAWWRNVEPYLSYPGFEAWKFLNLGIFIAIMVYLLKKPLNEAFKAKREAIRAELIRAEEERQAALARLTASEAKLARIRLESEEIMTEAEAEARAESLRIETETESEINRLRNQAASEIERKSQQVKLALRRFSAEESVRLAEEKIKKQINAEKDARLVKTGIQSIGGLN